MGKQAAKGGRKGGRARTAATRDGDAAQAPGREAGGAHTQSVEHERRVEEERARRARAEPDERQEERAQRGDDDADGAAAAKVAQALCRAMSIRLVVYVLCVYLNIYFDCLVCILSLNCVYTSCVCDVRLAQLFSLSFSCFKHKFPTSISPIKVPTTQRCATLRAPFLRVLPVG